MVSKIRLLAVVIFSIGLLSANFRNIPDIVTKVGTCAGNWLKLETGTRAIGMGGAHVAAGNGVYAAPYNPASIGFVKGSDTTILKASSIRISIESQDFTLLQLERISK